MKNNGSSSRANMKIHPRRPRINNYSKDVCSKGIPEPFLSLIPLLPRNMI